MSHTVVVAFYSRNGETERLATAAAVGAVQARAGIRMRRLADIDPSAAAARHPGSVESLRRMQKEYVAPREADLLAADALVVGLPDDLTPASPECAPFFDLLAKLSREGRLAGKAAGVVRHGRASESTAEALRSAGLRVVETDSAGGDEIATAMALGRQVVAAASRGR